MKFLLTAAATAALLTAAAPASAADRVVAGLGTAKVNGKEATVEVLVAVPEGTSVKAAKDRAIRNQGAIPVSNEYSFTGLHWEAPVTQNYNPAGQRVNGQSALTATHSPWSTVSGSTFRISGNQTTTRCPSLVRECPGAQRNDRLNDVGWARLQNGTLGVTWSTAGSTDEADMAINTRYNWSLGCTAVSGSFDLQSVFLHENGHVAGLGHSTDRNAVMYPSYQTARCALGTDDRNGIAALY